MASTIKIKNSSTAGAVPGTGDLVQGELAVNVTDTGLYTENASGTVVKLNAPSIDDKNTGATKYVTIASGGNVGIGTSSPTQPLTVGNTSTIRGQVYVQSPAGSSPTMTLDYTAQSGGHKYILYSGGSASGNFDIYDATAAAYRATIDSSGNLLVGATSQINGDKVGVTFDGLTQNGIVFKTTYGSIGSVFAQFRTASAAIGNITQNGASTVSYATSSDYRLKENIAPMTGALSTVLQLNPVTYNWKADGSSGQGFIAHELQTVVPDAVTGEKDAVEIVDVKDEEGNVIGTEEKPVYQGIDTSFLVATLTAAIQEQQALITALTARIEAIEAA